ncbi:D-alanine--D-alanyl carrier protein ligase [Seminavis robusta]|uniref:D-alanine--D-alanyl carrier protein ligase n=1 Tax=Seminavis robusta TaxID=568900 RepID=A0A9N8DRZ8_9STRA|nr:D-alanine--D-alanyl carrier protein ligase [Seminavis robusta]|eukprot:Sro311_g114170.1 D-alanine--D-alanyl carrier protein ligase (2231) ;mRNA; f:416-7673
MNSMENNSISDPRLSFSTLTDVITYYVKENPNHPVHTWLNGDGKEVNQVTYKQLDEASTAVAVMLLKKGCKKGDRVMIAYPFGLEFFAALLGAIRAQLVPCSIYPPNPKQLKTELAKFKRFAEDAGAKYALTTGKFAIIMRAASFVAKSGVKWLATDNLDTPSMKERKKLEGHNNKHPVDTEHVAFVQYTSGSTGFPKGVALSHRAVLENCRRVTETCKADLSKVAVIWLPQYHDMGLVGGYLTCFYSGCALKATSPLNFLSRPLLWNEMITKYKANVAASPNFGCALLMRRLQQAKGVTADWSCVDRIILGAEPLTKEVVTGLQKDLNMRPEAISNVFGLAECGVWITGSVANLNTMVDETHINCGPAKFPHGQVRIVQDKTRLVPEGEVGNIFAQSTTVATCYYGQAERTVEAFRNILEGENGYWLDTGDLGTIVNGELYVVGRAKDVLIVAGKNHYPTDIEATINNAHAGSVKSGRIAVFQLDAESIGVAVEHRQNRVPSDCKLHVDIAGLVSRQHGLEVQKVVIVKPGKIPKTTSGKLRRFLIKQKTMDNQWSPNDVLLRFERPQQPQLVSPSFLERSFSSRGFSNDKKTMEEMHQEVSQEISMSFRASSRRPFGRLGDLEGEAQNARAPSKAQCPFSGSKGVVVPPNVSPFTIGAANGTAHPSDASLGWYEFYKGASSKSYNHRHLTEVATIDYPSVIRNLSEYERRRDCGEVTRSYDLGLTMLANKRFWTEIPGCGPRDVVFALDNDSHCEFRKKTVASLANAPSKDVIRLEIKGFLEASKLLGYNQIRRWTIQFVYRLLTEEELSLEETKEFMALQGFTYDAMTRPHDIPEDESMLELKANLLRSVMVRISVPEYHASAIIDLMVFAGIQIATLINNCLSLIYCENKFFDGEHYELNESIVRQFVWECVRLFPLVGGVPWYDGDTRHVAVIDMCGRDSSLWGDDNYSFRPNRCTVEEYESRSCFFAEQAGKYGCPARDLALEATCAFLLEAVELEWERSTCSTYDTLPFFDRIDLKQKRHIVVVGGGIAGLACAMRLAEGGTVKVTVIEKNESIGGHAGHVEVFDKNVRNPAFGAFTEREWPNLVALTEELGVERIRLGNLNEAAGRIALDGHVVPEAPEPEVRRFMADMLSVYQFHSTESMETSLGEFLDSRGYTEDFIVYFVLGRMTFFFAGQTVQEYLDYPVYHFAWFVVAQMMATEDVGIFRLNNKEYMKAIEARLKSLRVELLKGTTATLESREGQDGVRLRLESEAGEIVFSADKLVLAMPPNAASAFLSNHVRSHEHALTQLRCPSETVVLHKDDRWGSNSSKAFMFALMPNIGEPLPSRDQTVPLTTSMVCDNDGQTKIYSTHSYGSFNELDIVGPKKYFSFVHTKLTKATLTCRETLQQNQGKHNTYFVGGWSRGFMLHEDALVSGIDVANSILQSFGKQTRDALARATPLLELSDIKNKMEITKLQMIEGTLESQILSVLENFLGPNIDVTKSWTEFGLSSIKAVELAHHLQTEFLVPVPADFDQTFENPQTLLAFLAQNAGTVKPFPIETDDIGEASESSLSWPLATFLQLLGCIALLFVVAISLIPSYFFVSALDDASHLLQPIMIPIWYTSFSMVVVACKWIVIGRYTPQQVSVPSMSYLRWWFVDRLVHAWENWCGFLIKGTPLITITYKLLGAKIHPSASIDSFLREFDLIKVGSEATVEHPVRCRKFSHWKEDEAPTLRFRPVEIGNNAKLLGHAEPGVSIGDGSCVQKLSSVPECAKVPPRVMALGSPSYQSPTSPQGNSNRHWFQIGLSKCVLLWVQLYLAAGLFQVAFVLVSFPSPALDNWRYGSLCRLFLILIVQAILMVVSTIPVKWMLIGKRRPGPVRSSWVREAIDWFADYNYHVSWMLFSSLGANSVCVNLLLKLLGLDVDLGSKVWAHMFPPSQVDLICINDSFVSETEFCTKNSQEEYQNIYIEDCNIGHTVVIEAGGPPLVSETVPPMTFLSEGHTAAYCNKPRQKNGTPYYTKLWADVFALFFLVLLFMSVLPTVEVWKAIERGMSSGVSHWMIQLVCAIVVQSATLYISIILAQILFYPTVKQGSLMMSTWRAGFLQVYFSFIHSFWHWSFLHMFWRSPGLFGPVLKGLGSNVDGRLIYFGGLVDDFPRLSFADRCIIDSARLVAGHAGVRNQIHLGQTHLSGLVHPGSLALGNTQMNSDENVEVGPMVFITTILATKSEQTDPDIENQLEFDA